MKKYLKIRYSHLTILFLILIAANVQPTIASDVNILSEKQEYKQYEGRVIDKRNGEPLIFATITVDANNISTVTNNEGDFILKVPTALTTGTVSFSFLGYKTKKVNLADLSPTGNTISLEASVIQLSEVDVNFPSDAEKLVKTALRKKEENYFTNKTVMTAFYRETIKKRKRNVSLSEAVVNLYKASYATGSTDQVELFKARKSTNYNKLDTVALKLQGGPFSTLYLDIVKYPEFIFAPDRIQYYDFAFDAPTEINGKTIYIVNFKQKDYVESPLYYGKLFIDAQTLAITSAVYNLNVKNRSLASELFVKKKPSKVNVYPTLAAYRVDYREKDGKWYYGYSNVKLTFKVNKRRRLFNSIYSLSSEMAITDWELNTTNQAATPDKRLKPTVVISDQASGFSDPEFWGALNVIEPEKSIESAINKIKKQLKRKKS